ncbi:kinase-like protein [Biscogniauxia marginata]|nr:kinase-like protein [Biscogniauxia marginata]
MVEPPLIPRSLAGLPWTHGLSGAIFFISEHAVIKRALSDDICKKQLDTERQIYERLGPHPYITTLVATHHDMLVLERLQYPLRQRLLDLRKNQQRPAVQQVVRWALQTAEALQHVHSRGVKQVDIGTYNVLLDWNENAKLSDFAGSSLDGSEPTVAPSAHSTHPRLSVTEPSVCSELFAFGSLLYEVETTYEPYHDRNDGELEELFGADQYPDTSSLVLGEVIRKCWMTRYTDANELIADIRLIQDRLKECS